MIDDPNNGTNDVEATLLRSLADEPEPSADLEHRIAQELERRGFVRAGGRHWIMSTMKVVGVAAALGVVFLIGFKTGDGRASSAASGATASVPPAPSGGDEYMLLMFMRAPHDAKAPAPDRTSEGYRAIIAEYRAWAEARAAEGRLVSAEKLSDATRVMTGRGESLSIATSSKTDRVLGGYFLITAPTLEDAIALAKTHPHLKYGGEVEVRPIEKTR
jgi:hypothetical protein